jgi:hypothetical protein
MDVQSAECIWRTWDMQQVVKKATEKKLTLPLIHLGSMYNLQEGGQGTTTDHAIIESELFLKGKTISFRSSWLSRLLLI